MKKGLFILISLLTAGVVIFFPQNFWSSSDPVVKKPFAQTQQTNHSKSNILFSSLKDQGTVYLSLSELKQKLQLETDIDYKDGTVSIQYGKMKASFVKDVSVFEKNGLYYPMKTALLYQSNEIWIPMETVAKLFDGSAKVEQDKVRLSVNPNPSPSTKPTMTSQMTSEQLISYLSFLKNPIYGAHVSTKDSSLPGAPRTYRKGVHEGIDWYGGDTTGVTITKKTPVHAIADGVVVRADHDYQEMTTTERNKLLALGKQNDGQTPQYVLDKVRGRSVWIQHDRGVMARYVHLDRISPNIQVGKKIKQGEIIGYVGNSGTSDGAKGNDQGVHLHLDLFIYGQWVWDQYTIKERREILERVFPPDNN